MLPLNSPRWHELRHAYGSAADVPDWMHQLQSLPDSAGNAEPWFGIWSALAHQGDVFDASYAAVPHVVEAMSKCPEAACFDFFMFPAWVEVCRVSSGPAIPEDLRDAYVAALARIPELVAVAARHSMTNEKLTCALAAIAAAKGQTEIAEVILELTPEAAVEVRDWLAER